jgi:hypothetical protein
MHRDWFDLPAQQITDEVKRDLRLLRLRGVMDPKRFYKSFDQTKFPKYFQFGTVVEGPADFYAGGDAHSMRSHPIIGLYGVALVNTECLLWQPLWCSWKTCEPPYTPRPADKALVIPVYTGCACPDHKWAC